MDKFLGDLARLALPSKVPEVDLVIDNDPIIYESSDETQSESDQEEIGAEDTNWFGEGIGKIAASGASIPQSQMESAVKEIICKETNEEVLQSALVDTLGFENLEFVGRLLQERQTLATAFSAAEEIGLTKAQRDLVVKENQEKQAQLAAALQPVHTDPRYPHVYRKGDGGSTLSLLGNKYTLPEGTVTTNYGTYEEVDIPAPIMDTSFHPKRLVAVSELDELCQTTFSGYKTLNKMQSLVFPVGYETNENMLICAPTGAGKTDVAIITMLNTIRQFSENLDDVYKVHHEKFKIVYVAPLKALAAEIVEKASSRLGWLGIRVRELTGDMQLTRAEIRDTQVIVTTPEKWDVVTRKPSDDDSLSTLVKLLIIDEVHLLHEERGAVIESLVARTLRQVESSQSMIRIVGLSATLPNFLDVAEFLKVNPQKGLFFFDSSFRPVPLEQVFVGVNGKAGSREAQENLDKVCYQKLAAQLSQGHQVMVFVHSRKDTFKTAQTLKNIALTENDLDLFEAPNKSRFEREMANFKNKDMREIFDYGLGIHHAGMSRAERNLSEKLFLSGAINVLCCTATLAWGVNLPAAVVIIKGTQVYDAKQGGFVDLGISDVIQIFGRAGRPQFEKVGTGILCTTRDRLAHYLSRITNQFPIESRLAGKIPDNLNAEISLGTVTNVEEGIQWLGYTYLFVRMRKAPQKYGLKLTEVQDDPYLGSQRRKLIVDAAHRLQEVQMIVYDDKTESFSSKDLGRIASDFYLLNTSVEVLNKYTHPDTTQAKALATIARCGEFDAIKTRKEEIEELEIMEREAHLPIQVGMETPEGKTSALIQSYISRLPIKDTSLSSDSNYVAQNFVRIARAFFLICLGRRWGRLAATFLDFDKAAQHRLWPSDQPLLQFDLQLPISKQLQAKKPLVEDMKTMSKQELGDLVHNMGMASRIQSLVSKFPLLTILDGDIQPITSKVVRICIKLVGDFVWDFKVHGSSELFWVWVQNDDEGSEILHSEKVVLTRKNHQMHVAVDFAVPISDPAPDQLILRVFSDRWLGSESCTALSFKHLIKPQAHPIQTQLLKLRPLPVSALQNANLQQWYQSKFLYFNPMQTMCFHSLYNDKTSILLGSPTGSGKTVACELALWAALRDRPGSKVVYVAPMKALVKERMADWRAGICKAANLRLVEMTGDTNPRAEDVKKADIIITTPEKFDGVSRNWQARKFVQEVSLIILDEVHLLASDRGATLEMIVSRMNFVQQKTGRHIRIMGMSTAVANPGDMASWLGVQSNAGLFNFPSSVRPVPLEMYIDGFPDNIGFCPLMKSMNKPAFMSIKRHAWNKPTLVFVPSRRQTRLTAQDFIHMCGNEDNTQQFLHLGEEELASVLSQVKDETLRLSLQFGIAIHHAGLVESDRRISHELFAANKVQILIATSTLAWGVNLPAYHVVIKGTQFFDSKINKYRDMDLTDVLQMMGRAGRPAYDTSGVARVFTKNSTKSFYKYFLNIGFPVESSLHKVLEDHIGAEISAGTIQTKQGVLDFLSWTFLYRRIHANPTYYGAENVDEWLVNRVEKCLEDLENSHCLIRGEKLKPTPFLKISSFYYLSRKTMKTFLDMLKPCMGVSEILQCVALATEYDELAIRHNEDLLNEELSTRVPYHGNALGLDMVNPHVKAFLLLQARMSRVELPIEDYIQDTVTVLDQAIRIMQAMIDTAAELALVEPVVLTIKVLRCLKQGCLPTDNMLRVLPGLWHTRSKKTIKDATPDDGRELRVPHKKQGAFRKAFEKIPKLNEPRDCNSVEIRPHGDVYCPHYHKQQPESWFVLNEEGGELKSLRRVQRAATVQHEAGTVRIMNDTIDLDYLLG